MFLQFTVKHFLQQINARIFSQLDASMRRTWSQNSLTFWRNLKTYKVSNSRSPYHHNVLLLLRLLVMHCVSARSCNTNIHCFKVLISQTYIIIANAVEWWQQLHFNITLNFEVKIEQALQTKFTNKVPSLFLVHINDLPLVCETSKISLFADDTIVRKMGRYSENETTEDGQKKRSWFDMNKLTVNVEKCESISSGRAQG